MRWEKESINSALSIVTRSEVFLRKETHLSPTQWFELSGKSTLAPAGSARHATNSPEAPGIKNRNEIALPQRVTPEYHSFTGAKTVSHWITEGCRHADNQTA